MAHEFPSRWISERTLAGKRKGGQSDDWRHLGLRWIQRSSITRARGIDDRVTENDKHLNIYRTELHIPERQSSGKGHWQNAHDCHGFSRGEQERNDIGTVRLNKPQSRSQGSFTSFIATQIKGRNLWVNVWFPVDLEKKGNGTGGGARRRWWSWKSVAEASRDKLPRAFFESRRVDAPASKVPKHQHLFECMERGGATVQSSFGRYREVIIAFRVDSLFPRSRTPLSSVNLLPISFLSLLVSPQHIFLSTFWFSLMTSVPVALSGNSRSIVHLELQLIMSPLVFKHTLVSPNIFLPCYLYIFYSSKKFSLTPPGESKQFSISQPGLDRLRQSWMDWYLGWPIRTLDEQIALAYE